jgi:cyclopropane fatty-acyl-phospholipid synthase-like methyltransferase
MFEHVGVPNYARFFQKIRELLRPDGLETGTRNEHFHGPIPHTETESYLRNAVVTARF